MKMSEELGRELRRLRVSKGLSQRALTKRIGLSAHSNIADYETGRRIPPRDIVAACERVLGCDTLVPLLDKALAERAARPPFTAAIPLALPKANGTPTLNGTAPSFPLTRSASALPAAPTAAAPTAAAPRRCRLLPAVLAVVSVAAIGWSTVRASPSEKQIGPAQRLTAWDGNDPKAAGCAPDAVSIDSQPVGSIGLVLLRYSRACRAAWATFHPLSGTPQDRAVVVVEADRPVDGIKTSFQYPLLTQVYGDVLLTVPGCVRASATVTLPDGAGASGSTACLQGG